MLCTVDACSHSASVDWSACVHASPSRFARNSAARSSICPALLAALLSKLVLVFRVRDSILRSLQWRRAEHAVSEEPNTLHHVLLDSSLRDFETACDLPFRQSLHLSHPHHFAAFQRPSIEGLRQAPEFLPGARRLLGSHLISRDV